MRTSIIIFLSLLLTIAIKAQEIKVLDFKLASMDISASTYKRVDGNNDAGALVKVLLSDPNARFEGQLIGNVEYKNCEYWVYLTADSKYIKVKIPNTKPLQINFADFGLHPAQSLSTYELVLAVNGRDTSIGTSTTVKYTLDDFRKSMELRERLISRYKYNEAINSLETLKDSISSIADSLFILSINKRRDFCKRQIVLKQMGAKEVGTLSYGRVAIKKNDKYGLVDSVGNLVAYPQFENGMDYNNGVAWVKKNGLWGNLSLDGYVKIPFQYKYIMLMTDKDSGKNKWIQVSNGKTVGIIDYVNGAIVHPFQYDWEGGSTDFGHYNTWEIFDRTAGELGRYTSDMREKYDNSYFFLKNVKNNRISLFNKSYCKEVASLDKNILYAWHLPFNLIKTDRIYKKYKGYEHHVYGIVDEMGRTILECNYQIKKIRDCDDCVVISPATSSPSECNSKIFSLKTREYITDLNISHVDKIWQDWFWVSSYYSSYRNPYYNFINRYTGYKASIEGGIGRIYELPDFKDKLLVQSYVSSSWFIFNADGSFTELPKSEYSYKMKDRPLFQYGVQPFRKNGKWGFVNIDGKVCVEPIYDEVSFFGKYNGVLKSEVTLGDKTFYIGIDGKTIE